MQFEPVIEQCMRNPMAIRKLEKPEQQRVLAALRCFRDTHKALQNNAGMFKRNDNGQ